jgi:NAD(P)-dependent dehydrogenase (short-subunit alcohol dehydrogenase family)
LAGDGISQHCRETQCSREAPCAGVGQAELEAAAALLGPSATPVQGDVSKPADLDRLYGQIQKEVGRVDVVFANAGTATLAPLGSLTEEHVDTLLDVNVKGVIWTVQKALPLMGPGGSIILNASIVATKGWANWSVYSATKAAVGPGVISPRHGLFSRLNLSPAAAA